MYIIQSYSVAVIFCVITMLCWGSWANTQKMASREWRFPLFYWDYSLGLILTAIIFGLTFGSIGSSGRSFIPDLLQADLSNLGLSFLGGVIFNAANLLVVVAIDIAGMAVAFPLAIGLALVIGVLVNYIATPLGDPVLIFTGLALLVLAIVLDALAYRRLPGTRGKIGMGLAISLIAGVVMGFFYRFVAASMVSDYMSPEPGKLTSYSAMLIFTIGIFISNFLFNTYFMYRPVTGDPVRFRDYFRKGSPGLHLVGILGGLIWCTGMEFNLIAAEKAGYAISYGLGQGATMVAAAWGVFIWKEFRDAPRGTNRLLGSMFFFFITGLALIIIARLN